MTCITKRRRGEKKENIQIDKNTEKNKQREKKKEGKTKEGKSIDANTNLTLILTTRKIRFKNNNKKRGYEKMKIKGDLRKEQK